MRRPATRAVRWTPGHAGSKPGASVGGLTGWFFPTGHEPAQSDLLRKRAVGAIPQLMSAITAINERRSGRSDRSADFRVLARWFAEAADDRDGHRLARAAFALNPARHFSLDAEVLGPVAAATRWADAPPLRIHPRLRALWRGRSPRRAADGREPRRGAASAGARAARGARPDRGGTAALRDRQTPALVADPDARPPCVRTLPDPPRGGLG